MAIQTLAEAVKLINNDLIRGVAEDIIDVSPWHAELRMDAFTGQSVTVNRENALGDVEMITSTGSITAKAAATFVSTAFLPTVIVGDAEVSGLNQATSANAGVDQTAIEISSKSKNIGRRFQAGSTNDPGTGATLNSMHSLVDSGQFTAASAGQSISFELLDELFELIKSKDGVVDWGQANGKSLRKYKVLLRALGGSTADFVMDVPFSDGRKRQVITYEGTPIFLNDHILHVETANGAALTGGALTSWWAGVWDDGSRKVGSAGIYPAGTPVGLQVELVGTMIANDAKTWRVKQYVNFAQYNRKGLGRLPSINNT